MIWKRRLLPSYTIQSKEFFYYSIGRQRLRQNPNIMDAAIQSLWSWADFRHCQLRIYERRWEQEILEEQNIGIEKHDVFCLFFSNITTLILIYKVPWFARIIESGSQSPKRSSFTENIFSGSLGTLTSIRTWVYTHYQVLIHITLAIIFNFIVITLIAILIINSWLYILLAKYPGECNTISTNTTYAFKFIIRGKLYII